MEQFRDCHKVFDEELNLDIISLHFKEEKKEKEKENEEKIKDNEKVIKKKLTLDDIVQRYSIKKQKIEINENQLEKRNSITSADNLRINLDSEVSNHNLSWLYDNKKEKILDYMENKFFDEQRYIFKIIYKI